MRWDDQLSVILGFAFGAQLLVFPALAQSSPQPPADAQGQANAGSATPTTRRNALVLRDILPHLERFLASERLQKLLRDVPMLADELRGLGIAPKQARQLLGLVQHYIPREVLVTASSRSLSGAARGLTGVAAAAISGLPEVSGSERRTLAENYRLGIKALGAVSFSGTVVARNERTAESWLDAITEAVEELEGDPGLQVEWFDDGAKIVLRPSKLAGGRIRRLVQTAKLPLAGLDALTFGVHFQQVGAEFCFALGPVDGVPALGQRVAKLRPAKLGPLWTGTPEQVLYARCDAPAAASSLQELAGLLALHLVPIRERLSSVRPGIGLQLESLMTQLEGVDGKWEMSATIADALVFRVQSDLGPIDGKEVANLRSVPPEIVAALQPDGSFHAASIPLDWYLQFAFEGLRAEVTKRAGRESARGRKEWAHWMLELLNHELADLVDYVSSEASAVFDPGCAVIQGGKAAITGMSLVADGAAQRAAGGEPVASIEGLAILGMLAEGEDGREFVDRVTAGISAALGGPMKPDLRSVDFGLGVPTQAADWTGLQSGSARLAIEGEMQLHWFRRGRLLGLSTSQPLSRSILGAQVDGRSERVASWARTTGAHWADVLDQVRDLWRTLDQRKAADVRAKLGFTGPMDEATAKRLQAVARALRSIGDIESRDTLKGSIYEEVTTMRWAK